MRGKALDFSELYDVRAFRVIVDDVKTCYAVLGIVHNIWTPDPEGIRRLHLAAQGQRLPVAAHGRAWPKTAGRSKCRSAPARCTISPSTASPPTGATRKSGGSAFKARNTTPRSPGCASCLPGRSEVVDAVVGQEDMRRDWVEKLKAAALDDRIYVLTPQARVIELPRGATPIDFAYHLHSDVGHRCRGAKVDGVMVPLNTALKNGQTVEIITAKGESAASGAAGPSRDWLSADYAVSARTRTKIRAWFNAIDQQETLAQRPRAGGKNPAARRQDRREPRSAGAQARLRQARRFLPGGRQG